MSFCRRAMAVSVLAALASVLPAAAMTDEVRSMCSESERLINSGKTREAISLLNRAATMDPSCGEVHGYLGMALQNSMKTKEAVEEYKKAIELNPQMSFINVNIGNCYLNLDSPAQAVPYFQKYLEQNPNAPDAASVRMAIQKAGARGSLNDLRGVMEKGQSLMQSRRYAEARSLFEQAVAISPDFAPAHFYLGYARSESGDINGAIDEFQKCLSLDGSVKEAVLNIASCYQSLGDCDNAISFYRRYLAQNPGSPKARDIQSRIDGLARQARQSGGSATTGTAASTARNSTEDYFAGVTPGGRICFWPRQKMPVKVFIAPGNPGDGYRDSFTRILFEAFSEWAKALDNRIGFTYLAGPQGADIICDWTGDPSRVLQQGGQAEGGLTRFSGQPSPDGRFMLIGSARITILCAPRGATAISDDDMKKVCLHEVGHAVGLNGHSDNNKDVMFYSESPSVWPALTKRDKETIRRVYAFY